MRTYVGACVMSVSVFAAQCMHCDWRGWFLGPSPCGGSPHLGLPSAGV